MAEVIFTSSKSKLYSGLDGDNKKVIVADVKDMIEIKLFTETVALLCDKIVDLEEEIQQLKRDNENIIAEMETNKTIAKDELEAAKTIVKPDESDVHNINRRIEILAQKIALFKSDQRPLSERIFGGNFG